MDKRQAKMRALERQVDRLARHITRLNQRSDQFSRWRLGVFLAGLVAGLAALAVDDVLAVIVAAVALGVFLVVVRVHSRVQNTLTRFRIWRRIKQGHLARMRLDWAALPESTAEAPRGHPFALDLDIIGEYSIHRLLDTTISQGGSQRLLNWLLSRRPDNDAITQRQTLIRELIPVWTFRDRLTLDARQVAGERAGKWDGETLLHWLQSGDAAGITVNTLLVLGGLSVVNIVLFLLFLAEVLPALWLVTFIAFVVLSALQWRKQAGLFDETLRLQAQVTRLRAVFDHLENYPYANTPALKDFCAPFLESKPSHQLRRIGIITTAASLQRNPIVWLALNLVIPWDVFFAYLLERSKGDLAAYLPGWLERWYDLEALNALATFADLNPRYTFPTVETEAVFSGTALGHPLIPEEEKVRNDFTLDSLGQIVIITGSNMSGKSSFLRTLGMNLVLAYAGSVTDAATLTAGLMRVFTSVRVTDSVVDGISYFYAEVRRLRALLDELHDDDPCPLFFLIDEIFRGTNNRERLIGSRAYIQALVGGNGIGLISTHDLELVKLADGSPQISNMHFREDIIEGRMSFDYVLREGPSPTTNALKIMQLEGLPVAIKET